MWPDTLTRRDGGSIAPPPLAGILPKCYRFAVTVSDLRLPNARCQTVRCQTVRLLVM
jgi:hypothetical protein